jgi:hypothetical protein
MIAQDVMPQHEEAQKATESWIQQWKSATLQLCDTTESRSPPTQEQVEGFLVSFGLRFIDLASELWEIQRRGIENAAWFRHAKESKHNRAADKPIVLSATANEATRRLLEEYT